MSAPSPIGGFEAHISQANGTLLAVIALLLAIGFLVYLFRIQKKSGAREEVRQQLEADLDRRTAELLEAERRFKETQRESDQQQRLLLRELTHRSKNLLAVIQAIARQTARQTASVDEFLDRFGARLHGIGVSHDLLVADDWNGASLRMLLEKQLDTHLGEPDGRAELDGEDVILKPEAVHNLGMAFHELRVNAEKYGALSQPSGAVKVRWEVCEDEKMLKLVWEESGGPEVMAPAQSGFGRALLEKVVAKALSGTVALSFPVTGVRCDIAIPASHITSRG